MPSSADRADGLSAAVDVAAARIRRAVAGVDALPVIVLIDGRSGAGKTTLARRLAALWPAGSDVAILALDDVYPGWDGLRAGAVTAADLIAEIRAGRVGRWATWDWTRSEPGPLREVCPADALIVEGAGTLTSASAARADVRVWLEAPAEARRDRALDRDGEAYRPHWERWAAQEEAHLRENDPRALADLVIDLP